MRLSLDDYNIRQAHSAIDALAKELCQAKKDLEDQKALVCGKLMPVADYPIGSIMTNVRSYQSPDQAGLEIEAIYQKCLALKAANQAAIKNNMLVYDSLRKLITAIGIPSSYNKIVNNRSRRMKIVACDWVDGLKASIPMQDKWEEFQNTYNEKMKEISDWKKQIVNCERHRQQEEQKNKWRERVAMLADKYGLPISSDANEVLEVIFNRSKYMALADAMIRNRIDWSDGPDIVRSELRHFAVENDIDKLIYECLSNCVNNWDGDGRVFRDCEYNYNKLFSMADKSLFDDYKILVEGMEYR